MSPWPTSSWCSKTYPGRQSIPHIDVQKHIHGDTVFMIIYVIIFLGNNLPLKSSPSAHSQMIHNEFVASEGKLTEYSVSKQGFLVAVSTANLNVICSAPTEVSVSQNASGSRCFRFSTSRHVTIWKLIRLNSEESTCCKFEWLLWFK